MSTKLKIIFSLLKNEYRNITNVIQKKKKNYTKLSKAMVIATYFFTVTHCYLQ